MWWLFGLTVSLVVTAIPVGWARPGDFTVSSLSGEPGLVEIVRVVKLGGLCGLVPVPSDRNEFEGLARARLGGKTDKDRAFAARIIQEGIARAMIDFKAAPIEACASINTADLKVAANYLIGGSIRRLTSR